MTLEALRYALMGISAYRNMMDEPLMKEVSALLEAIGGGRGGEALERYSGVFYRLRQEGYETLGGWLHDKLRYEDGPYPRLVERGGEDRELTAAAERDVEVLSQLSGLSGGLILSKIGALLPPDAATVPAKLPRWSGGVPFVFASLTAFYRRSGAGLFARNRAFLWEEGALRPVDNPDCTDGAELIGYERQRDKVIANTRAMMEGNLVNNVLLYGDPGTGKSVTVKSLLTVPGFEDLRLIEVRKEELGELHDLIPTLAGRRHKFILFIDDLAFDQDDKTYSVLKTILEGGLERRPANVAVYATSNRRHLVRQTFSDRAGDEVDRTETIAEKTSLSERFGLRIPYLAVGKPEFLDMVERMADLYGVSMDRDTLRAEAVKFEMHHPGRTPRTARQFIASLSM